MDLGLERKRTEYFACVYHGSTAYEENTEMIVPDQSPDILRIVKGQASVFAKDKNARNGKIDVSGAVKGAVLYVAEGESTVRALDVNMPFAYVVDAAGVGENSKISATARLRSFDVREINPRKIAVKASVELHIRAYEQTENMICESIPEGEKYGMCVRKRRVSAYLPVFVCEKSFVISDDIELAGTECDMHGLVTNSVALAVTDTKIIGNKSIIKGNATVSYVFLLEDGTLESSEKELPFSQIIDISGMNEENDLKVELSVSGFELEPQYDASGKARYMTASISADALATVFAESSAEAVDDVYSTKYDLDISRENVQMARLCDRNEKRVAVTESLEAGMGIKRVLDVSVELRPAVRRREEGGEVLASEAAISVMYVGEDDSIYNAARRASVVCPIPLEEGHRYETALSTKGKSFSVGMNNDINVRFFTDFDITELEEQTIETIAAIALDEEMSKCQKDLPSITVKRLERDFDIWSLAKKYSTTVEEIKLANNITEDVLLNEGRMVLIPGKR